MTSTVSLPNPDSKEGTAGTGGPEFFLGVEKSLTGKRWIGREADSRQSLALAQRLGMTEIIGRVLVARGVGQDFSFIEKQRGMFSFSSLSDEQVRCLREEKSIYIVKGGRINVAGILPGHDKSLPKPVNSPP